MFGLFSLLEGLIADMEAHTKHSGMNGTGVAVLYDADFPSG